MARHLSPDPPSNLAGVILEYEKRDGTAHMKEINLLELTPE